MGDESVYSSSSAWIEGFFADSLTAKLVRIFRNPPIKTGESIISYVYLSKKASSPHNL
jgi:hypothetical protein